MAAATIDSKEYAAQDVVYKNTDDGLVVTIWDSSTHVSVGTLTFRGADDGSGNYAAITGDTKINFNGNIFTVPKEKKIASTRTISNTEDSYLITGTSNADTITNTADNVTINALNDTVKTSGKNTSINAGVGNDTVEVEASAENVTISAGTGNDLIISNGKGGNVYRYTGGKDSIYGFSTDDVIYIDQGPTDYFTTSVTADGLLIKVKGSSSNSILLKGASTVAGSTNASDYALLDGGNSFSIYMNTVSSGFEYKESSTTIAKLLVGDGAANTLNASIEGYTVQAYGGDDTITTNVDGALIDAGAGNDTVTVAKGANVTIIPGTGNDFINISSSSNLTKALLQSKASVPMIQFTLPTPLQFLLPTLQQLVLKANTSF